MSDFLQERLSRILRRWPGQPPQIALADEDSSRLPSLIGVTSLVAAWSLETALWRSGIEPLGLVQWFLQFPGSWGILFLLILWNSWVLDQHLERVPLRGVPRWLRALRAIAASFPLLGLWTVPAWRWLSTRRQAWSQKPPFDFSASDVEATATVWLSWERLRHRAIFSLPGFLFWMIGCQFLTATILIYWLVEIGQWSPGRRWAVLALCCIFHLSAVAAFFQLARLERGWLQLSRRIALSVTLVALLLPAPFSFLGFVGISIFSDYRDLTFTQHFYERRGNASQRRLPSQQTRRRWRRWMHERESGRALGESERQRRSLYRLKILLLFFDAGLFGWLSSVLHIPAFSMRSNLRELWFFLLLTGLGLLLEGARLASRMTNSQSFRGLLERHSYGAFLSAISLMLLAGLLAGSSLGLGDIRSLALLLTAIGLLSFLIVTLMAPLFAFRTMIAGGSSSFANSGLLFLVWIFLLLSVFFMGVLASASDEAALKIAVALRWAFWLSPLCHLVLWLALGDWLLHPLRLLPKRLPRQVSWRRRIVPVCLSLTALVPGGGLFVPFWIFARQKWWSEYAKGVEENR